MTSEEYQKEFKELTDEQLIARFNGDVGKPGWVSSRGAFHMALHREFIDRGFDCSAISDRGRTFSLKNKICLEGNKIKIRS